MSAGGITDDGERYPCKIDEYITADHAKHIILALKERFDEDVVSILDGASHFQASKVSALAERGGLSFIQFLAYSPYLHPGEECWRQLKEIIGNQLVASQIQNSKVRLIQHFPGCQYQMCIISSN